MSQKQPLEPIGPGLIFEGRQANVAGYMARMADYANRGLLAESTLHRLQMPLQVVQGHGLPDLVLRKDEHGRWYVFDRTAWTLTEEDWEASQGRNETVTPERNVTAESVTAVTERNAPMSNAERQRRHREKMRAQRAAVL